VSETEVRNGKEGDMDKIMKNAKDGTEL